MSKWTILAVALACGTSLLPSEASAGRYGHRHHRRACCCSVQPATVSCCTANVAAPQPQMAQTPPAPGGSYQSFSYEPGGVVPAPTAYYAAPVIQSRQPHYLSGSYKALGNYGR
jgi:hypothetical protein